MNPSNPHIPYEDLLLDNQHLRAENQRLVLENLELKSQLAEMKMRIIEFGTQLGELKRQLFGQKSERFVSGEEHPVEEQLKLFVQHPHEGTDEKTVIQAIRAHEREQKVKGKPKREKLPFDLPVLEILITPHKDDIAGWVKIGEEITEELDYVPGHLRIIRYIRPKYARPQAEQLKEAAAAEGAKNIYIAPLPTRVIEKGIPSAGLLAHILISKFVDHLPLHRTMKIFQRAGVSLSPSTVNGWIVKCVELLRVLYQWHKARIMEKDYLMADETTIKVLDGLKKGKSHLGYFWVYYDPGGKQVLFIYDPGRSGKYPREHLASFRGKLQTDGYKVYEAFEQEKNGLSLLGCLAHVRRKFEHALANDQARAEHVLKIIQKLYAIEELIRGGTPEERLAVRAERSAPLMTELKVYLIEQRDSAQVLPKSNIGQAINYALNRWKYVVRYLFDGRVEIDNNLVENAIRPVAIGRKNYLFAGSPDGAQWAAVLYSLLSSAANCGHNPLEYLKDVLQRLPDQPLSYLDELLPNNWKPLSTGMASVNKTKA